jgi:hypothetical protein
LKKRFSIFKYYIRSLHRKAPELKQRLAGKSIPFEKFSVSRCKDYFEKEQYLWLPALVSIAVFLEIIKLFIPFYSMPPPPPSVLWYRNVMQL